MKEKISESTIRQDIINALKNKILNEIDEYNIRVKEYMKLLLNHDTIDDELWKHYVDTAFFLEKLTEFINREQAFTSFEVSYPDRDMIIYTISSEEIDIWLQEDYNFVHSLLFLIESENGFWCIYNYLNDRFLSQNLTNIFERILYNKKQK